jgi:hypothetical protein
MENLNKTHLELPFLRAETTLFKGPISNTIPDEQITMGQVLLGILKGRWQKEVKNVRELKNQYLNSGKTENNGIEQRKSCLILLFQFHVKVDGT